MAQPLAATLRNHLLVSESALRRSEAVGLIAGVVLRIDARELGFADLPQVDVKDIRQSNQVEQDVRYLVLDELAQTTTGGSLRCLIGRQPLEQLAQLPTSPTSARISDFGSW